MECQFCDHGQVDLMIQGEVVETITCPHCDGNGNVTAAELHLQNDCIAEARKADAAVLYW